MLPQSLPLLLLLGAGIAIGGPSTSGINLPSIDFAELVGANENVRVFLQTQLTELGALQIKGIPRFEEARAAALEPLSACLEREEASVTRRQTMSDGSQRISTGAASTKGQAQPFSSSCGETAGALRQAIDLGVRQLLLALDAASSPTTPVLSPYPYFEDLLRHGDHLEHLHVYFPAPSTQAQTKARAMPQAAAAAPTPTIDFHTDGGLFIAMTSGLHARGGQAVAPTGALYLQTRAGLTVRVNSADLDGSLVFMVGEGGARWLAPRLGAPLRAVPHMLAAALPGSGSEPPSVRTTRAWYGKMYLPPADATVAGVPYRVYREGEVRELASSAPGRARPAVLPAACGGGGVSMSKSNKTHTAITKRSNSYGYGLAASSTDCQMGDGTQGIYCWMQCMAIPTTCGAGTAPECFNSATGSVDTAGDSMCESTCSIQCMSTANSGNSPSGMGNASTVANNGYCYGSGTSMIMDGFRSQGLSPLLSVPCINFLLPKLTLDTRWKFAIGCLGAFLMGTLLPYFHRARIVASRWKFASRMQRTAAFAGLYFSSTALGYLLMLLAMTYSTELFIMVLLGLTCGFCLFMQDQAVNVSDPCCDEGDSKGSSRGLGEILIGGQSGHGLLSVQ